MDSIVWILKKCDHYRYMSFWQRCLEVLLKVKTCWREVWDRRLVEGSGSCGGAFLDEPPFIVAPKWPPPAFFCSTFCRGLPSLPLITRWMVTGLDEIVRQQGYTCSFVSWSPSPMQHRLCCTLILDPGVPCTCFADTLPSRTLLESGKL